MAVPAKQLAREHRAKDFAGVVQFLTQRHILSGGAPTGELLANLRKAHGAAYSLFLWKHNLKKLPEHGHLYVRELASDAIQVVPLSVAGYRKGATVLMRGVLENVLRHVYFLDHPIEFQRANSTTEWHVRIRDLQEYISWHPIFQDTKSTFDGVGRLKKLYQELSLGVHGSVPDHMDMRSALDEIVFDPKAFANQTKQLVGCAATANFLLSCLHSGRLGAFPVAHQQLILDTIPKAGRRALAGL